MTNSNVREKTRKLQRIPGLTRTSEFGLVPAYYYPVADPNGYYRVLGLSPSRRHTPGAIRRAYLSKVKEVHPDVPGGTYEGYERVQCAMEVLGDPRNRAKYDSMVVPWIDQRIKRDLHRRLVEDVPKVSKSRPRRTRQWSYYVDGKTRYEILDEEVAEWLDLFSRVEHERGVVKPVLIGFTESVAPRIEKTRRGEVYVIPIGRTPSLEYAQAVVELAGMHD